MVCLTTGKVSANQRAGAEPGGLLPSSSMATIHVRSCVGSVVWMIVGNSERT